MTFRMFLWGTLMFSSACEFALAQSTTTSPDTRMDKFEQRLNDLEKKYQSDLKVRDEEIARLKTQLSQQPPAATKPDEIEKTKQDILKDIESREPSQPTL